MDVSVTDQTRQVAEAFVQARRDARNLSAYPGRRPGGLAEAYAIQDCAIALDGRSIAGWKVGRIHPPDDQRLGANRLVGPVFADAVLWAEAGEIPLTPVYEHGFVAAEAELLLHVRAGWNGAQPRTDAETQAVIDEIRLGIEIASSPYPAINADGPAVTVSDFGNNACVVLGAAITDWLERDLNAIQVRTHIDGAPVGEGCAATMLDGPYGAVRFLLDNLAARGMTPRDGTWVSTGAITGVHAARIGQIIDAEFDGCGSVGCRLIGATPRL